MLIYIPSRGRVGIAAGRGTLRYLTPEVRRRVILVVPTVDEWQYRRVLHDVVGEVLATDDEDIAATRYAIGRNAQVRGAAKFLMLDDDLTFLVRRDAEHHHQTMAVPQDLTEAIAEIEECLDDYASVGLSARERNGLNGCIVGPRPALGECDRLMRAVAFRTQDFLSVQHKRVTVMEDHDVQLQLLRSGRANACLYWWASGQVKTGNPGGCSLYRTTEVHNAAARRLAELHPGLVKLRSTHVTGRGRKTGGEGMVEREEVTIQWKRALGWDARVA